MEQVPFVPQKVFTSKEPSALICLYWAMMLAGASIAVNAAVTTRKAVSFLKEVANIEDCRSRLPHPMSSHFFKFLGGYGSWWKLSYLLVEGNPNGWFLATDCIHFCLKDEGYFLWKLVDSVSGPLEAPENLAGQCAENVRLMTWLWPSIVHRKSGFPIRISPAQVAVQLATRYEACQILEPAIALTRFTLRQVEVVLERDDDEYLSWQSESSSVLLTCNSSGEEWEEATRSVKGHMRHLAYWTSQTSCWSREANVFHQSFPFYHMRPWLMLSVNVWTCFAKMPGKSTKGVLVACWKRDSIKRCLSLLYSP